MKKYKIYAGLISIMIFISGCSNMNQNSSMIKKTQERYSVGTQGAKHKLVFVDYRKATGVTREITFYLDSFSGRQEFNLCEMDPRYKKDLALLLKKDAIVKVNNFDLFCNSYLEMLDNKDSIMTKYSISWYKSFKEVNTKGSLPMAHVESRLNQEIDKKKTTYIEGKKSYWKVEY